MMKCSLNLLLTGLNFLSNSVYTSTEIHIKYLCFPHFRVLYLEQVVAPLCLMTNGRLQRAVVNLLQKMTLLLTKEDESIGQLNDSFLSRPLLPSC